MAARMAVKSVGCLAEGMLEDDVRELRGTVLAGGVIKFTDAIEEGERKTREK